LLFLFFFFFFLFFFFVFLSSSKKRKKSPPFLSSLLSLFPEKKNNKLSSGRAPESRAVYERAVEVICADETEASEAEKKRRQEEEERPSDGVIVVYRDDPETAPANQNPKHATAASSASNASRLYLAFAAFEALAGEPERARAIYRHALDKALKKDVETVFEAYSAFERSRGDREGVDAVVAAERRLQYEARVEKDARDYDAWFEYARLEEGAASAELAEMRSNSSNPETFDLAAASAQSPAVARVREVYERAVAALPPSSVSSSSSSNPEAEKRLWCRYVYLWIFYAVFEELAAGDSQRAAAVYRAALGVR